MDVAGKNELFARARALLHLNTIPERFGLVLAEANAAGVPVIAMDLGSCREVIEDGRTGFLVNNVDEAVQALRTHCLRSIAAPAANASSNASPSTRWWRHTNGSTRQFSIWKRRGDHEAGHRQAIPPAIRSLPRLRFLTRWKPFTTRRW